jgi:hypothetical protein
LSIFLYGVLYGLYIHNAELTCNRTRRGRANAKRLIYSDGKATAPISFLVVARTIWATARQGLIPKSPLLIFFLRLETLW